MEDRTDHNRLAELAAARLREEYVEAGVARIEAFERRARGEVKKRAKRQTAAAEVVTAKETTTMSNVYNLFQPATPTSAFLKMGIMGKQGAGKSRTAAEIAIGLIGYLKAKGVSYASKPVAIFDTEPGFDWLIPMFDKAGIPVMIARKRAFVDLVAAVKWAEENASAMIIDSITHPWRELQDSYLKKKERSFLQIDDWSYLKGPHGWQKFTDLFINSKLHIIMCGRAGDETEQYTDDNGKRQFEKVGVKMKTEAETGHEPSLLVLMEREMNLRTNKVAHRAYVLKDRADLIDGKEFDDPTFEAFLPHIERLNIGGTHTGVQQGDSSAMLKTEKRDWTPVQREICIDEIQTLLQLHYPSQSAEDKKNKLKAILQHFDATWTEIEKVMPLPELRAGFDSLHQALEGKPSKYAATKDLATATAAVLDDALPDFAAAAG